MEKKILGIFVLFGLTAVILLQHIAAAGVATPYWDENPLRLAAGENKVVTLNLQNMVGGSDITLRAEITKGSEIAAIDGDSEIVVPFGRDNVPLNIDVSLTPNENLGDIHEIGVSFNQVSEESGQMLHVASAFTTEIPVKIVTPEESLLKENVSSGSNNMFWIGLVVLVVLGILVFLIRKRNN